jgi:hypothetical protein
MQCALRTEVVWEDSHAIGTNARGTTHMFLAGGGSASTLRTGAGVLVVIGETHSLFSRTRSAQ